MMNDESRILTVAWYSGTSIGFSAPEAVFFCVCKYSCDFDLILTVFVWVSQCLYDDIISAKLCLLWEAFSYFGMSRLW